MSKPGNTGLTRIVKAFGYSMKGFAAAWKHEAAFRQEVVLVAIGLPLAFWLGEKGIERALLAASLLAVLFVELLNSAIEAVVDKASPEFHELAGRAKDAGSAAVLVSLITAAVVWVCILGPRYLPHLAG